MHVRKFFIALLAAAGLLTAVPAHAGEPIGVAVDIGIVIEGGCVVMQPTSPLVPVLNAAIDGRFHSYVVFDYYDSAKVFGEVHFVAPGDVGWIQSSQPWTSNRFVITSDSGSRGELCVIAP